MEKIKVSLIIPIYNSEAYIARCLDSLLKQTLKEIEIICVNDGSFDNSELILNEYSNKHKNIKVYKKENGGCGSARNMGIDNANGEYIEFVDSDDELRIDAVEIMYISAKNNNSDLVVCGMQRIDENTGKLITTDMMKTRKEAINLKDGELNEMLFVNPGPCNKMHKKEIFNNARFPKIPVVDDLMLTLRYMPNINTVSFVKEPLYKYKVRRESGVNTVEYSTYEKMKKELLDIKKMYIDTKLSHQYIEYIDKIAYIHVGISILYRMTYIKDFNLNIEIQKTFKYLNENFDTWKKMKSLGKINLTLSTKVIAFKLVHFIYKIGLAKWFINLYKLMITKFKIDIKW